MSTFIKLLLAICLLTPTTQLRSEVFTETPTLQQLVYDLEDANKLKLASRIDDALDGMMRVAVDQLFKAGRPIIAKRLEREWAHTYKGELKRCVTGQEVLGDHAPLSQWLADTYEMLLDTLGPLVMQVTHLEDIYIFVMAVPVVLHMDIIDDPETIDVVEYGLHWEPLASCLAYWGTYLACTAATWGTAGWIVCTPVGLVAKGITAKVIAPRFTQPLWEKFYPHINLERT